MPFKKFIVIELLIILSLTSIFLLNVILKKEKVLSTETKVAMSYYGNLDFTDKNDTVESNIFTRLIKETYGFDIKYDFAVPTSQYETKINTSIASGSIPDMFSININQFSVLTKADLVYDDLTEIFDKTASDDLKKALGWDNTLKENSPNFKKWCVNGKLKAIPGSTEIYSNCWVLYIRKDWLDIIGEDTPKTLDDVEIILTKFKDNNLGKGLGLNEDILYTNSGSANFVFNAYDAYPTLFVDDGNGGVNFGFLESNCKSALSRLRSWYSQGLIYSGFSTISNDIIGQKCASGDCGMIYGIMSIPLWKLESCVSTINGSDFIVCKAPSLDGTSNTKVGVTQTNTSAYVIKKNYESPERLIQMMNLYYELIYSENGRYDEFNDFSEAYPFKFEPMNKNYNQYLAVKEALEHDLLNGDFNTVDLNIKNDNYKYFNLNGEAKYYYRNVRDYLLNGTDKDGLNWALTRIFYGYQDKNGKTMADGNTGFDSCFSVIDSYIKNDSILITKYEGVDTETYSKYRRTIESKINQMFKMIIIGEKPLSYFDQVVDELKNGYCKTILEEINAELNK